MSNATEFLKETVFAIVRHRAKWLYLAADIDMWVLDWKAWSGKVTEAGLPTPPGEAQERAGIWVLDGSTWDTFFDKFRSRLLNEEVVRESLRREMPIVDWFQVSHLFPTVYVDFDSKVLRSVYAETLEIERYVPEDWDGKFAEFYSLVPAQHRYWVDGANDCLRIALAKI